MIMRREWAMPNSETFSIKPILELILKYMEMTDGLWCDPFARNCHLAALTNDINPDTSAEYHIDALDFLQYFEKDSMVGVLYDPPYSPRQIKECYDGIGRPIHTTDTQASFWRKQKDEIARLVKKDGYVLSFGWNSVGMGKKRGFEIVEILLVSHGSNHNDTICTVEKKIK